ncbi:cell division protein ZipA [Gammaproteobacteria bacterium]
MRVNLVRITLILIGIGILVGIWRWELRRRRPPRKPPPISDSAYVIQENGGEPFLDFSGLDGVSATRHPMQETPESKPSTKQVEVRGRPIPSAEEKLVVIHLIAPIDSPYFGVDLLTAAQDAKIGYGEMNIFHHRVRGQRRPVFSVANLVEPGTFNPPAMVSFFTPGLTFFMRLPGPIPASQAIEQMIQSAQYLAAELGGEIRDSQRRLLDEEALNRLRKAFAEPSQEDNSLPL